MRLLRAAWRSAEADRCSRWRAGQRLWGRGIRRLACATVEVNLIADTPELERSSSGCRGPALAIVAGSRRSGPHSRLPRRLAHQADLPTAARVDPGAYYTAEVRSAAGFLLSTGSFWDRRAPRADRLRSEPHQPDHRGHVGPGPLRLPTGDSLGNGFARERGGVRYPHLRRHLRDVWVPRDGQSTARTDVACAGADRLRNLREQWLRSVCAGPLFADGVPFHAGVVLCHPAHRGTGRNQCECLA